tara:strand:- start:8817 stop:9167 length:351 start_codon:yes stop_codon:yes gene_type:complete
MKNKNWVTIFVIIAVAIIYYLWSKNRFISQKIEPTSNNDWDEKSFVIRSPFGRLVINGNEDSAIIVQDENYELGTRNYVDYMEVYMIHKNESDEYSVCMITYDYDLKTIFPEYRKA